LHKSITGQLLQRNSRAAKVDYFLAAINSLLLPVRVESPIPLDHITQGTPITGWQPKPDSEGLLDVPECIEKLIVQVWVRSAGAHE